MCSIERRGRVFILTLTDSSPHVLNSDSIAAFRAALASIRSSLPAKPSGFALVTTNNGRFFSNGFDLAFVNAEGPTQAIPRISSLVSLFRGLIADLLSFPMPTVAAVNGHAAAAGFMLAIAHDYVHMRSDRGVLYMSELDIGFTFPPYFVTLMKAKFGNSARNLRDAMMQAAKFGAKEAMERGIVDFAHADEGETLEKAVAMAGKLAGRNWEGGLYASIRIGVFKEVAEAVGAVDGEGDDGEKLKTVMANSKL